ncbi:MAG: hypothetical protein JNK05_01905 [Myxococcales bacterium]|nr:hypothetical protein [Myxococcales bacterium]
MRVQLVVTEDDLRTFFVGVTPARLDLGRDDGVDRWIEIDPPESVTVTESRGLTLRAPARLRWNVAGINVPIAFRVVEVTLDLAITEPDHTSLRFIPQILDADFVGLPAMIERGLIKLVNSSLSKASLVWNFVDTLQFSTALSSKLHPPTRANIRALSGVVKKADKVIALEIEGTILPERATDNPG